MGGSQDVIEVGQGGQLVVLNIGDAEQGVYVEAALSLESKSLEIIEQEMRDRRDRLHSLIITVPRPAPEQLWLTFTVYASRTFPDRPVVLRSDVGIELDGEWIELGALDAVIGGEYKHTYGEAEFDVLAPFEGAPPDSFRVLLRPELLLMPAGTGAETLDPRAATVDNEQDRSEAMLWTTVRIEFESEAAAPSEPAEPPAPGDAAAETPAAAAEAPAEEPADTQEPALQDPEALSPGEESAGGDAQPEAPEAPSEAETAPESTPEPDAELEAEPEPEPAS